MRAPEVFVGIEAIRAYFAVANHPSAHHVSNVVVYDDGELTRVKSKFFAPFTRATRTTLCGGSAATTTTW